MTTEQDTLEPLDEETSLPTEADTSDSQEQEQQEAETDYKSKLEKATAELVKLQNDLRAAQGRNRSQIERDRLAQETAEEVKILRREVQALTESRATEDDTLAEKVLRIKQEDSESRSQRALQAAYDRAKEDFIEAISDETGNPILILRGPELQVAVQTFEYGATTAGLNDEQRKGLWAEAIKLAHKATMQKERETLRNGNKGAANPPAPRRRQTADLDMDTGPGSSGGGRATPENIDALWFDFDMKNPGRKNPYEKQYRELLGL